MAGIKSDIMNKSIPSSQGLREFEVSDESMSEPLDPAIEALAQQYAARGMPLDPSVLRAMQAKQAVQQFEVQEQPIQARSMIEVEKEFSEARRIKVNPGKTRLSSAAKRRIELLSGLKRNTKKCKIDEYEYELQTLKNKELREAILAAAPYDGTVELPFETRKQLLARSLTHIAGTEIGLFLGDPSLEAKLEFLDELDERISDRLYSEYLGLINEINSKYAVKNEADAKEVADHLKK